MIASYSKINIKKILIIFSICSIVLACNSSDKTTSADDTITKDNPSVVAQQSTGSSSGPEKGKELISKLDCLGCHKLNEKLVGPSYADVAKKYEANDANINLLATKIISGGMGVWGEIPMAPHPAITQDDAKEMSKYILSIK